MDAFTEEQKKDAKVFGEFYVDLVENYKNTVKYYLSDDVILDWFGQTVKGDKNVNAFLKSSTMATVKHFFSEAEPAEKIGYRDTHVVKLPKEPKKLPFTFINPPRNSEEKTPTKTEASTSAPSNTPIERGQGDGFHNHCDLPMSPAKKLKKSPEDVESIEELESETDGEKETLRLKYMMAEGAVEFHRPSSKKLQTETKWRRPCKLSVAYTSTNCQDSTIYLIIYEGNVKCRRNLLKDFSEEEPEN